MMTDTEERWGWIPGWEQRYMVSTMGRVRSHLGMEPKALSPGLLRRPDLKGGAGYYAVALYGGEEPRVTRMIHRLVLLTFRGPPPDGFQAAHENGNPLDNRLENLKWKSPQDNQRDKIIHGTTYNPIGAKNSMSKLTEEDVEDIHNRVERGESRRSIAESHGVNRYYISRIVSGERWPHAKRRREGR